MTDETPYLEIGKRLQEFRKSKKIKQSAYLEDIGQMLATTSKVEKGKTPPNVNFLVHLHQKYGLNINWALSGEEQPEATGKVKNENVVQAMARIALLEDRINKIEKLLVDFLKQG